MEGTSPHDVERAIFASWPDFDGNTTHCDVEFLDASYAPIMRRVRFESTTQSRPAIYCLHPDCLTSLEHFDTNHELFHHMQTCHCETVVWLTINELLGLLKGLPPSADRDNRVVQFLNGKVGDGSSLY